MNFPKVLSRLFFETLENKTKDSEIRTKVYYDFLKGSIASIFSTNPTVCKTYRKC